MANQFFGYLGTKYDKSSKAISSTSYDTDCAAWTEALENNEKVGIHKEDDFFLIRIIDIKRRMTENCFINGHVVSGSILKLLEVIEEACDRHTITNGYNTDAVYCENPCKEYPINSKGQKFTSDLIRKVLQNIGETPSMIDKSYRKNMDINDYILERGKGTLITGAAGCGKTTKLINDAKESKNPIIFSFTNKAVDNIRSRVDDSLKNKVHTFDSYFNEFISDAENLKLLANKDVFIDKFSMVPNKWITLIYNSFVANNLKVNLHGDMNQCDSVEDNSRLKYDYTKSPAILEMCSNVVELQYIKDSARYDKKTYDMLSKFLTKWSFGP